MNTKNPFKLLSARMLLTPLLLTTLPLSAADTSFRAGAAQVDITPPTGTAMSGQNNKRLSTGVLDPIHAKAIVVEQDGAKVALVALDLC